MNTIAMEHWRMARTEDIPSNHVDRMACLLNTRNIQCLFFSQVGTGEELAVSVHSV